MSITQKSLMQIVCTSVASLVPVKTCQCIFTGCHRANSYMSRLFTKPSLGCTNFARGIKYSNDNNTSPD